MTKTNVMRVLEQHDIDYTPHEWADIEQIKTSETPVYKTLVTVAKSLKHYVFVVPTQAELDLKKAAAAVGEKKINMIKEKELEPLTGYVHGGCSPIGMKKEFVTVFDTSALDHDTIYISAGKVGMSVEVNPLDVSKVITIAFEEIKTDN